MENKKTIIGIIIVVILIIALIVLSYLYYKFNTEQVKKLTEESNILLQMDIATEEIDEEIKTEKNFATVEKAMKEPGGLDDVRLREGDELVVPQFSNTVKISGEVMYPISINYEKGKSLGYYIKRAGGYADRAHKSRVYAIYMNGAVEQLGRRASKSIQPGCEIVVPTKPQKNKLTTGEIMTIGTSTASIATMIVTLVNLLK